MFKLPALFVAALVLQALATGAAYAGPGDRTTLNAAEFHDIRPAGKARLPRPRKEPGAAPRRPPAISSRPQGISSPDGQVARARALPDLMIRGYRKVRGHPGALRVRIVNLGQAPSAMTRLKGFYHRSGQVVTRHAVIDSIAPGGEDWVAIDFGSPLAHANLVGLRADDPNLVSESDEGNNSSSFNP